MSKLSMRPASRGTIHIYSQHRQAAGWTATKAIGMRWKAEKSLLGLEHVADQVDDTVAVAPLVVVPRDELDEVVVQSNPGLGIEDARPVETSK